MSGVDKKAQKELENNPDYKWFKQRLKNDDASAAYDQYVMHNGDKTKEEILKNFADKQAAAQKPATGKKPPF